MRYRYGLRSELLRSRPLRELDLRVKVNSATKISKISSASHAVRARHTEHSASAEFEAEEFTPERDFELTIEFDRSAALTVVPHRRGEDGYLMLLLSPDGHPGKWQRELVPENGPLEVMLIADTSASMDPAAREARLQEAPDVFVCWPLPGLQLRPLFCLRADLVPPWVPKQPATQGFKFGTQLANVLSS